MCSIITYIVYYRRISEGISSINTTYSDVKSDVLSEITRKAAIKEAKELADATQLEYVRADQKSKAGEETVRKVHQKQADKAMDVRSIIL